MLLYASEVLGGRGGSCRAGGGVHPHGTVKQHLTQRRVGKARIGDGRSWGHQGQGGTGGKRMGEKVRNEMMGKVAQKKRGSLEKLLPSETSFYLCIAW